jgi:quercetin dioxygenase-like cupin family protein
MTRNDPIHDPAEWAALYVAGALTPEEAAAFETQLAAGDAVCAAELKKLEPVAAALFAGVPPVAPALNIRDALLRRVKESQQSRLPDLFIQRGQDGAWQELGIPGVQIRMLFQDRPRNLQTFLLRMAAGAMLPAHPHKGAEECYVIEGDVQTFDTLFHAGDYVRAPAGSMHGESRSERGCLLLITSAIDDDVSL